MMYNRFQYKFFLIIIVFLFLLNFNYTDAVTSFSFEVTEGQGMSDNEFYHGRCVRADIMLDTDNHDTGGADLEINYDNSRIKILNNDCNTTATKIYHESQYNNYVNNHVTSSKITLGSYNNSGNTYNGSGRYAYFYFEVLDGSGDYDLDFEFTPGDTTDTNLAELGSGNDILDEANSYKVHFADDDNVPYVTNLSPLDNSSDIQVISDIKFRLNDDGAGIDINTLNVSLSGTNWGATNYSASSAELSYNCHTTNANRVDYCDITINPNKNLYYCEEYKVDITVSDLGNPTVHTLNNYTYKFRSEIDDDAPTVYELNPQNNDVNVALDSNIKFNIHDIASSGGYPGTGVDISSLEIQVSSASLGTKFFNASSYQVTITPLNINDYGNVYDYNVSIDLNDDLPQNELITVKITAKDYGCSGANSLDYTYSFTSTDTIAPICDLFSPKKNTVDIDLDENIKFRCRDTGVGIDINSVNVVVDGIKYVANGLHTFSYSGNPSEYYINISPVNSFSKDYAFDVIINASDFSGNKINQISYGLATAVFEECENNDECPVCEICTDCQETVCKNDKNNEEKKCEHIECDKDTISKEECYAEIEQKTYYKNCSLFKDIDKKNFFGAITKIPRANLNAIDIVKINNIDVKVGNKNPLHWLIKLFKNINETDGVIVNVLDDTIFFEGSALPNSRVTLIINSEPLIVTGLANSEGKWKIEMQNILTNGVHTVSAVAVSEDDYIIHTKELVKFNVQRFSWWCIIVIAILLITILALHRKYKRVKKKLIKFKKNYKKSNL